MDPAALLRYKKLLLEKQQELSSAQFEAETRVAAAGASEGDLDDIANADAEAELQIRVHQSDVRLLRAIEDALARMRHGNYGVCTSCEKPISKARLEAVPWTHLCRECKEDSALKGWTGGLNHSDLPEAHMPNRGDDNWTWT